MEKYNPKKIEHKWQQYWEEQKIFSTPTDATAENKCYILPQLPYPSGSGLHVGHAEVYTACDIYARYQRMRGKKVLHVFGLDSFGIPAENYAIKTNVHPKQTIEETSANFVDQVQKLGVSVDWDRFVRSSDPEYYKFTQWFFLLMYERGLAYRKKQAVNWCESCKTVLANDQVTTSGECERCGTVIVQKEMEQWYLKITDYAEKLLEGLDRIDWPEETKKRQRDWIGKSEGAEIEFLIRHSERPEEVEESRGKQGDLSTSQSSARDDVTITVFTTRPDTLFGATYMVLAPEGEYVKQLQSQIHNWDEVETYIEETAKKTDLERQVNQEKTGVELKGVKAVNPANGEAIPIWIADYVIATYGTGAIMAVPAHDERDFAFAKENEKLLPKRVIKEVVVEEFTEGKEEFQGEEIFSLFDIIETSEGFYVHEEGIIPLQEFSSRKDREEFISQRKNDIKEVSRDIIVYNNGKRVFTKAIYRSRSDEYQGGRFVKKNKFREILGYPYSLFVFDDKLHKLPYSGEGVTIKNSDFLNGLPTDEAKQKMIDWLEKNGKGKRKVQYRLRDWSVSRQRFWGAPIPMLRHTETGELRPIPVTDLPVMLPDDVDFKPTGQSPLTYSEDFQKGVEEKYGKGWKREVDTLDTFMCSSWYFFRYLDPHNTEAFASPEALKTWMPVDFYLGGPEHVNGHLLFARFFTKVLFDAGYIDFDEPFTVHRHQGLILGPDGRKMSKRWGNVINPTDIVDTYGADAMRMYEMFMGPLEDDKPWDENGIKGIQRFLDKVYDYYQTYFAHKSILEEQLQREIILNVIDYSTKERFLHKILKRVEDDLDNLKFNTAISSLMILFNELRKDLNNDDFAISFFFYKEKDMENIVKLLSPFAPHMAEELWNQLGHDKTIAYEPWPEYDESKLVNDTVTIAVQVNGKVRASISVSPDALEEEVTAIALAEENVVKWMEGNETKKVIYVQGKIVNIVV